MITSKRPKLAFGRPGASAGYVAINYGQYRREKEFHSLGQQTSENRYKWWETLTLLNKKNDASKVNSKFFYYKKLIRY
ncbi:MAG: hypothetical protein Q9P14_11905 [candidate division KSB1 bacterium]|nr:hypothetical protein [candidate division KSB1 bacterium]MDQ7064443.1 hypothetical protein [candidate division KSB1 bacterium]